MTDWWKKYGDKGRMFKNDLMSNCLKVTSTLISLHMVYLGQSDCIWNNIITTTFTSLSQNTTCSDIHVGVTCGQLDVRSFLNILPLFPNFFHQSVIPTFPEFFPFFTVLVCLLFWWPLATWMVSFPPSASTLILTSLQFCVFSIPIQAHSPEAERKAGKQQFFFFFFFF